MDLSLRDWVMVISAVVAVAVIGHALWLRWRSRQRDLKMDIARGAAPAGDAVDDLDLLRSELPNGGARVVRGSKGGAARTREQPSVGEHPPILLNTVPEPVEPAAAEPEEIDEGSPDDTAQPPRGVPSGAVPRGAASRGRDDAAAAEPAGGQGQGPDAEPAPAAPLEEIVILRVIARQPEGFATSDVLACAAKCGLTYGDFNIFHRYKGGVMVRKGIEYSMANAVEPGVFDSSSDDAGRTPAIAFFMQLPVPSDAMQVFDDMLGVANTMADALDGEVHDDRNCKVSAQRIEHHRSRILEFERLRHIHA